ncbi:unnamed protein product [Cylindrotheca closterium]|uniref:Protein kinase domain-containing protein n=1 Tax=Cylindrotheca closterium TaxID=2856 RepID=A0AAD2FPQ3_9STRA|nr:unnamed protein product [Cylindrotheca closterium]
MLHFPFVIGNGLKAILYVVHFQQRPQEKKTVQNNATNDTEGKIPKVSSVGASEYNLGNDKDRTELFFALCVLLHNIKETFKKERDKISNYQNLCSGKQPEFENASFSRKRGQSSSRDTTSRKSSATKKRKSEANEENKKRNEDLAAQAASCNGLFRGIEFPWLRTIVDEEDSLTIKYQEKSPYYFHGMDVSTGRKCFLKVWREDEEGFVDARTEMRFLKQAQNHNVAVARAITDEVIPVSVNGFKFAVLVTEYIKSSLVSSVDELVDFSLSLMGVVNELHEKAGILHCDIKPNNL